MSGQCLISIPPEISENQKRNIDLKWVDYPVGNYMVKVNNRNARTRCGICLKLTIKTPKSLFYCSLGTYLTPYSSVFIVNFEQINADFVMFLNNVSINFLVIIIGLRHIFKLRGKLFSQSAFSCSKLTIETLKQGVKHVYS